MRRLVKVRNVGETRTGVSQRTGEPWAITDVAVEWDEQEPNCQAYKMGAVISVSGAINRSVLAYAQSEGQEISMSFFMEVREYNGKYFNNVRGYLPKEFMEEKK